MACALLIEAGGKFSTMSGSLARYHQKRHFRKTPEPAGKLRKGAGSSYVIQKHDATRLHYDFRLELDGVLKSWAVPKGPSLDPAVKRLAVEVEDHPVEYGGFEGIIPEGEYGGGTVLLWDRGTWEPIGDPHDGLRKGKLKFLLHGEKLHGGWMLVRSRSFGKADKPQWLLIKERDETALSITEGDVLESEPRSVASGRDLEEIASAPERVWTSAGESKRVRPAKKTKKPAVKKAARKKAAKSKSRPVPSHARRITTAEVPGAAKQPMPLLIDVQLATLVKEPPQGDNWLHEIKFDGYRMICRIDGDDIRFVSRNQQDWTARLESLVRAVRHLPVRQAILDGEVVALKPDGSADFQTLQNAFREGRVNELRFFVFDLLYLDGQSLFGISLEQRKERLAAVLEDSDSKSAIQYSEHFVGSGEEFKQQACRLHLEGMISKRRDLPYQSGRGYDWLKTKCLRHEEFVIGGYTESSGAREGFGALLVGYHDDTGALRYGGKVGTGFDARDLPALLGKLQPLERPTSPFVDMQRRVGPTRTAHWVEPALVGQFAYGSRTDEGRLRHASFQGLREDKPAKEVVMDRAESVTTAVKKSGRTAKTGSRSRKKSRSEERTETSLYDAAKEEFAGVRLTSPDKVLYPDDGITKRDLAQYLHDAADWILPHVAHRPLVLVRCPDGRHKECFYQKHPGKGTPDILRQIPIQEKNDVENYVVVEDADDLIALAQIGALELHVWGSREDKLEFPDRLIFDLDPAPDVPWKRVVDGARQIRQFLEELGLESFVKTTGGKGLHLVLPIDRRHEWDEAKAFCKQVAEAIVAADPEHYTANMSKAARPNKIFLDYLRNGRGATSVAPYSTRSKSGATISTPLTWDELTPRIASDHFTIANLPQRLASLKRDPWQGIGSVRQSLSRPMKRLKELQRS